jgi:arylsulfatase A-like enzyme
MISMDWLPTLLAAAGTQPDPSYPPDGDNLLSILTGSASPHPRKLLWRFKAGGQRAVRDGDWKYLQIAGNEFLFDVVKDPRERANLKDRHKDVFDRLKNDWASWNNTMLAERARPAAYSNPGNFLADHYGVTNPAAVAPSGSAPTR